MKQRRKKVFKISRFSAVLTALHVLVVIATEEQSTPRNTEFPGKVLNNGCRTLRDRAIGHKESQRKQRKL